MVSYKQFVEEAISRYRSLPAETNDLYKKYFIDMPLDPASSSAAQGADCESTAREIEEKTRVKFDAVISDATAVSRNPAVKILSPADLDESVISGKLFSSGDDKMAAYSNAYSRHFILIDVKDGSSANVNLLFIGCGNLPSQVLIKAGRNSRVGVSEVYVTSKGSTGTVVALNEVSAGSGAEVELNVLHNEASGTNVVSLYKGDASDGSVLRSNFVFNGGSLTRSRNVIDSVGSDSQVLVSEIAFGTGEQRFDLGSYMANTTPRSTAKLESGTVLDGRSQCMLKGYAKVAKGARGCLSRITERGILLSADAHVDALPDMSIDYSNEVKATHSAATAPLDREAMFYMMSRGLEEEKARKIFITAFMAKYLSNMKDGPASEIAMSVMLEKLERGTFGVMPEITARGVWMASR